MKQFPTNPTAANLPSNQSVWAGEVQPTAQQPAQQPTQQKMPEGGEWIDLRHQLPPEAIESPVTRQEQHQGSLKGILGKNLGSYIVARFLIGAQNMVSCEGILSEVGNDYLVIYQEGWNRYVIGDYYSLKFAEFYDPSKQQNSSSIQGMGWQSAIR